MKFKQPLCSLPAARRKRRFPLRSRAAFAACALALASVLPQAAQAQQTLYVTSNGTSVIKITPDGTQSTFASGFGNAGPLALDAAGNLYIGTGSGSGVGGAILRYAPDGTQSTFTSYPTIDDPTGFAFDASGTLFESQSNDDNVSPNATVHKITPGGVVSSFVVLQGQQAGAAFDAAGNLYVCGRGTNSVTKVAPDGTATTFATGLNSPNSVAIDASGNLYVANDGSGTGTTVTKITPAGVQSTFASGLVTPEGAVFDQDGNLFVSNNGLGTITKITPVGVQSTYARGISGPGGIVFSAPTVPAITGTPNATAAVGAAYSYQIAATYNPTSFSAAGLPAGLSLNATTGAITGTPTAGGLYTVSLFATNAYGTGSGILTLAISPGALQQTLYVTNNSDAVVKVAPDGTQSTFVTGIGGHAGPLALDAVGNLYVGNGSGSGVNGQVYRYAPDGTKSQFADLDDPAGLAFDANGNLFAASSNDDNVSSKASVHKIAPDGTVTTFATLQTYGGGDAFDGAGNLYVASIGGNTVTKITPNGTEIPFASGLDEPTGVAVDASGNVYVANTGNGFGLTVTKITPDGTPTTYATGLQAPSGLAFDGYGNLYVSNNATHGGGTITEITPVGAKGTFAAGLTNPSGLVFSALPSAVAAPAITSATSASAQAGISFSYQITATNTPTSYAASGLPAGLTVNATSGLVTGAPTVSGTFAVGLSATNAGGTGTAALTLTVAPALPSVTLMATTPTVTAGSGDEGVFTLSLSAPQDHDVSVVFTIRGTAVNGIDYETIKTTKKIKAGKTSKPIKIIPYDQSYYAGGKKTVKITLQPGDGYTVDTVTPAKVKILYDR